MGLGGGLALEMTVENAGRQLRQTEKAPETGFSLAVYVS